MKFINDSKRLYAFPVNPFFYSNHDSERFYGTFTAFKISVIIISTDTFSASAS